MDAYAFPEDPIAGFLAWFEEARASGERQPEAMTLATATTDGQPSARMVLFKGLSGNGIRFFTNFGSRKAEELRANPRAATVFYWPVLERQVRFEGRIEILSDSEATTYFHSRPKESQLNSAVSPQSQPVESYARLELEVAALAARVGDGVVPKPAHWGGFRLVPDRVELWVGEAYRLHQRALYSRVGERWDRIFLAP